MQTVRPIKGGIPLEGFIKVIPELCLLAAAAWMDIRSTKISNRLILCGWMAGCIYNLLEYGWKGSIYFLIQFSIPVLSFYLLFLMRALGAGDIKLFSVIGSCIGLNGFVKVVLFSFLAGAVCSILVLIRNKNLFYRMVYFSDYVRTALFTKSIAKYDYKSDGKQNFIHFSVSIFVGYVVYLGGL